jgi:hypothetical protein
MMIWIRKWKIPFKEENIKLMCTSEKVREVK